MILVTGAAGKTGLAVMRALAKAGKAARALIHKAEYEEKVRGVGAAEAVIGNLETGDGLKEALDGVNAVYCIVPNVHPQEIDIGRRLIELSLVTGVRHFVYHSVLFPQIESMPHHWRKMRVEEMLLESGLNFTILQPASYMQNILAYRSSIMERGMMEIPYRIAAKSSPVDLLDVAEVAAKVLGDEAHYGAIYPLAGAEQLSTNEQAALLGTHIGQTVKVTAIGLEMWEAQASAGGLDEGRIETLKKMFVHYDRTNFVGNSQVVEMLLGRPPTQFMDFIKRDWT